LHMAQQVPSLSLFSLSPSHSLFASLSCSLSLLFASHFFSFSSPLPLLLSSSSSSVGKQVWSRRRSRAGFRPTVFALLRQFHVVQ
jgi:hypothetical protein